MMLRALMMASIYQCLWSISTFAKMIPLLGLNKSGNPVEIIVSRIRYQEALKKVAFALEATILSILQKRSKKKSEWQIRTAMIGLGINPGKEF